MVRWRTVEALARAQLPAIFAEILGIEAETVRLDVMGAGTYDLRAEAGGKTLLIEVLGSTTPALLGHWESVRRAAKRTEIPLLVVPFMTRSGRALCSERGINWVDLSGNASVRARGLHVRIEGQPDRFPRRGRPPSVFERRSSRLARLLLQHPGRDWSVRECATATGLNEGHVSRIVARLVEEGLLSRDGRRLGVANPQLLLDAWREAADFTRHRILRGHVPARAGEELLATVSRRLVELRLDHAATGLGAAWLYDHFAMFRLATLFLREWPGPTHLEQLHFHEETKGANVWLVLPADDGVFEGARTLEGIPCVHPVQVYVDSKISPSERRRPPST